MACQIQENQEYELKRLFDHLNTYKTNYQDWSDFYRVSTSETSAAIINEALGGGANFTSVDGTLLNVNGDIQINQSTNNGTGGLVLSASDPGGSFTLYHNGAGIGRLRVGTKDVISVKSNGFVGINVNEPTTELHVAGNFTISTTLTSSTVAGSPISFLTIYVNDIPCKIPLYAN